jgi:aldose 1-epimerase
VHLSPDPSSDPTPGPLPSGEQFELRLGDQEAVVTEVGAALRVYRVNGRDVIVPFATDEIPSAFHGAVLVPWPNRLRDGRYTFDGIEYQVPLTEPARQTALHGLAVWERWTAVERGPQRVVLQLDLVPTPGYPFPLRTAITYELTDDGLLATLTTRNLGRHDAPYGAGFHPWLSPGEGPLDAAVLCLDADAWIPTDDRLLPTGRVPVPEELDFREGRPLGDLILDDAFVASFRDGLSWLRLTGSDGRTAAVWMDSRATSWQLCSGDAIDPPGQRRQGLAAEPMTCVADAFRTGDDLIRLGSGQEHTMSWGLRLV